MTKPDALKEVLPDLYVVAANDRAGFGFSHLLRRQHGGVLLPRAKAVSLSDRFQALTDLGGVNLVLLSDRHFAGPGCREAADHFAASLVASSIEAKAFAKRCPVDRALDYVEQDIGPGVSAIPTPGHTPGQFAYRVEGDQTTCLFIGDLAYRVNDRWRVGNRSLAIMRKALDGLSHLRFDYVIGAASYDDAHSFVAETSIESLQEEILAACSRP